MTESIDLPSSNPLSQLQQTILDGFSEAFKDFPPGLEPLGGATDEMRHALREGFGLELKDDDEYFHVMAGVHFATRYLQEFAAIGVPLELASQAINVMFARLRPEQ